MVFEHYKLVKSIVSLFANVPLSFKALLMEPDIDITHSTSVLLIIQVTT